MGDTIGVVDDENIDFYYKIDSYIDEKEQYQIKEILSQNSLRVILKVVDKGTKEKLVAKVLIDNDYKSMFENEIRNYEIIGEHKNIAMVKQSENGKFELFQDRYKNYYILIGYAKDETLEHKLKNSSFAKRNIQEYLNIVIDTLKALLVLKERELCHRDIQPSNILLDGDKAILTDFGVAKKNFSRSSFDISKIYMSNNYFSPQQREDFEIVTNSSDIFSLGVILYEILTDEIPKVTSEHTPNPPSKKNTNIVDGLDELVLSMLKFVPNERVKVEDALIKMEQIYKIVNMNNLVFIPTYRDIEAFYISKYTVSNKEYEKFLNENENYPHPTNNFDEIVKDYPNHPVVNISWKDAIKYCEWFSKKNNIIVKLPTEKEWKMVCSGGDKKLTYPWGDRFKDGYANYIYIKLHEIDTSNIYKYIAEVKNYDIENNSFGCSQMAGNVWEWCGDDEGTIIKDKKKLKGGAFNSIGETTAKCKHIAYREKDKREFNIGFRYIIKVV